MIAIRHARQPPITGESHVKSGDGPHLPLPRIGMVLTSTWARSWMSWSGARADEGNGMGAVELIMRTGAERPCA